MSLAPVSMLFKGIRQNINQVRVDIPSADTCVASRAAALEKSPSAFFKEALGHLNVCVHCCDKLDIFVKVDGKRSSIWSQSRHQAQSTYKTSLDRANHERETRMW